jgi:hypothetical protein
VHRSTDVREWKLREKYFLVGVIMIAFAMLFKPKQLYTGTGLILEVSK